MRNTIAAPFAKPGIELQLLLALAQRLSKGGGAHIPSQAGDTPMIIVEGWFKLSDGDVDKMRDAAITMMDETRKEDGCMLYVFSSELANPNTIRISERWASMEALQAHGKTPHMADFNKALGGATMQGASVRAYNADDDATTLIGSDEAYG